MQTINDYYTYFMNDLYDDYIVHAKMSEWQNRMYHDILKGKEWYQNNRVINGDIFEIKVRQDVNLKYGLPGGTYSLLLRFNILPYYSEKKFFDKYGYETLISSMDILKDTKVFSKNIYFYMNGYLIHDVQFMIWKDRSIVFIPPSNDIKLEDVEPIFDDLYKDDTWTIFMTSKSDYYLTTLARNNLIDGNKIYLSKFPEFKKFNKPIKSNSWTMFMSSNNTSKNIMTATPTYIGEDDNGKYFFISDEFISYMRSHANVIKCLVINEPECSGCGIYIDSDSTEAVFQIPFKKNPIPLRNLIVWEYDHENNRKIHPLIVSAELRYPNIYDFGEMILEAFLVKLRTNSKELVYDSDGKTIILGSSREGGKKYDLYISWIEPMEDPSSFDSYIGDFIDCYKNEYAEMVVNDELPSVIREYNPVIESKANSFDYFESEYWCDYRAWLISKIKDYLIDNPKRYDELFHRLYYNSKKYLNQSYNLEKNSHIYDRSITSTNDVIKLGRDDYLNFIEDTCYIRVYDYHDEEKPLELYINGKLFLPSFSKKYGSTLYVFFPKKYIENGEDLQLDVELINNPIISNNFTFINADEKIDFEDLGFHRDIALSDIILYDYKTGKYLPKEDFDFDLQVCIQDVKYVGSDKNDTIVTVGKEVILFDKDNRLIKPTNYDYVVLSRSEEWYPIEIKESHKQISGENIAISIKYDLYDVLYDNEGNVIDPFGDGEEYMLVQVDNHTKAIRKSTLNNPYFRMRIGIASGDFYQRKIFIVGDYAGDDIEDDLLPDRYILYTSDEEMVVPTDADYVLLGFTEGNVNDDNDNVASGEFKWTNFKGIPSKSRFRIFRNGRRISPEWFELDSEGYDKTLTISFQYMPDGKYVIQYIGFDEDLIHEEYSINLLQDTNDGIIYLKTGTIMGVPFNNITHKVYIDGYRIPSYRIKTVGQGNMIYILPGDRPIHPSSTIAIYGQRHDDEPFDYKKNLQFLDKIVIDDPVFRSYMMDKYINS